MIYFFYISRCLNESKNIRTLNVSIQVKKNKDNKKRTNSTHEKKGPKTAFDKI